MTSLPEPSVDLQPYERHRAPRVAAISGPQSGWHPVEGMERADPEAKMRRDPEVPDQPERELADRICRPVMEARQLVIRDQFGAAEQGPEAEPGRAFQRDRVMAVAIAPGECRRPPAVRAEAPRVDRTCRPAAGIL